MSTKFSSTFFTNHLSIYFHRKDFDPHRIFGQVIKSTYNMLCRALPKDEHFALALHILKESHPELVSEKVLNSILSLNRKTKLLNKHLVTHSQTGMGIIYNEFCFGR